MKLPRNLSGAALVRILCRDFSYVKVHQHGSHIILVTEKPTGQRIAIPEHEELRVGTLNSILTRIARHKGVNKAEILESL